MRTLLKMLQKALLTLLCAAAATLGEWAVRDLQERLHRRRKARRKNRKHIRGVPTEASKTGVGG